MGFNHAAAGYPTVEGFVSAMAHSEKKHIRAFLTCIERSMLDAMRRKDWRAAQQEADTSMGSRPAVKDQKQRRLWADTRHPDPPEVDH